MKFPDNKFNNWGGKKLTVLLAPYKIINEHLLINFFFGELAPVLLAKLLFYFSVYCQTFPI